MMNISNEAKYMKFRNRWRASHIGNHVKVFALFFFLFTCSVLIEIDLH